LIPQAPADPSDLIGFTVRFGETVPRVHYVMINKILLYQYTVFEKKNETYASSAPILRSQQNTINTVGAAAARTDFLQSRIAI
jgi:hypothetical protein